MTPLRKPPTTLADAAYRRLRADLLSCRLPPGEPLKINELSILLETNPIAIREALSKLTAEGLVIAEAQKGFRASPISVEDLRDLTRARVEIECLCLRLAMESGSLEWESGIVAAQHSLQRTPIRSAGEPGRDSDDWVINHQHFHEALAQGCASPLLLGFRATLFARAERYRRLSIPMARFERDLDAEHKELAKAALSGNIPHAIALLAAHLRTTADILLEGGPALFTPRKPASPAA